MKARDELTLDDIALTPLNTRAKCEPCSNAQATQKAQIGTDGLNLTVLCCNSEKCISTAKVLAWTRWDSWMDARREGV
jgi:hypothetical protein